MPSLHKTNFQGRLRTDEVAHVQSDHRVIHCSPLDGKSRFERRRANKSSPHPQIPSAGPRHLGIFDGERKRHARAASVAGEGGIACDLAGLGWTCAFLLVVAFVLGAL